jgi:hypothetical protein
MRCYPANPVLLLLPQVASLLLHLLLLLLIHKE